MLSNSIHSNAGLGIDLGDDGVTPNDLGDFDSGANNFQNFPVLTSAISGSTSIEGTLNSTVNTTFRLEFFSNIACDPSGNGEGESFLGSTDVTTDGNGDVMFMATFPVTVPVGQFITATATDPNNDTSEFSQCSETAAVNQAPQVVSPIGAQTVTEGTAGSISVAGAFSDPDGDTLNFSETGLPASLTLSADGTISGTAGAADVGTHNVTITATDPSGESVSDNFVLTVEAAAPPPPPPRSSGGCTVGPADGVVDPTLPLLMLISLVYLHRRRLSEI